MVALPPDSQPGDAYLWTLNQCGHAMIGFGLALILGPWLAVAGYAILWEYGNQIRRQGGKVTDSITDTLFVLMGALLASFPEFAAYTYAGFAAMILIGVEFRR